MSKKSNSDISLYSKQGLMTAMNSCKTNLEVFKKEIRVVVYLERISYFIGIEQLALALKKNTPLEMKKVDTCKYNKFPVGFFFEGKMLSILPAAYSQSISRLMDCGKQFTAKVHGQFWYEKALHFGVYIYMRD